MAISQRSTLWVVTTHVLTTGAAVPFVAGVVAECIISYGNIRNLSLDLGIREACAVLGYVGGTYYSLSYLKANASHRNWTACTLPAVICFAILTAICGAINVMRLPERNLFTVGVMLTTDVVIVPIFWWVTARGFAKLSQEAAARVDPASSRDVETPESKRSAISSRLLSGLIGLVLGAVVGIGIVAYMEHDFWNPPHGWQNRIITATVLGVITALLAMISGKIRL